MPELGPSTWYIVASIAVAASITWTMRAAPFAILRTMRNGQLLAYLGERMPVGVMVILAAYTVRDIELAAGPSAVPAVVGLAATIGLHLWRGNMTLSMFGGTALYVALASALAGIG
ncbi:putative branched-chain amino acid transport protein [Pseudoclavibacter endophyticus]|uniref:branched-chain amino acid transporter permease n=1 Tax=Pseudoclavibacter endophyticus TaxID=1778590 RepID=UPI0019938C9E|nr:AzlD domain-containing protein [Pseudoclavibacter endophyticus]GGA54983.1 putative branched-chain amino acid transport protein [Pseudoclavibacter endophyticus]